MSKIYIGIDNGTSGTIGIILPDGTPQIYHTPVKKEQDYTKNKKLISRLNVLSFRSLFLLHDKDDMVFVLERPLINSRFFNTTVIAARCFESELSQIELIGSRHYFIDSKEWQSALLPKGYHGAGLKKASLDIGNRLFPQLSDFRHPDRDGILIAEYARRQQL